MSKLTKQHFIAAAEEISNGRNSLWKTGRERLLLVKFCVRFFKQWNIEFDSSRFEEACNEGVPARKTGGLKRALKRYKLPQERIPCEFCSLTFSSLAYLEAHHRAAHSSEHLKKVLRGEEPLKPRPTCDYCGVSILPGLGRTVKVLNPDPGTPPQLLACYRCYGERTYVHPKDIDDGRVDDRPEES
jgi:hypothetical protein